MYTVSRALSGADGVSEGSREQVLKVAQELGYIPNRAAQGLRKTSRDSVAIITASTSNSYYLDLMAGIQQALRPSSWTVVVGDVAVDGIYDPSLEDRMIRRLIESRTAGVISTLTLTPENTRLLSQWDIPVVFVDSSAPVDAADFPSVTTDNYNASLMVGQHLADHGYREWVFLVYPAKWSTRFDRERGLRDAARIHGANVVILESENDAASGYAKLANYMSKAGRAPQVLIAGNNPLLLGALNYFRDKQTRIPGEIAVVGYDEFAWASLIDPPITVLNESSEQIGRLAASTLSKIIDGQIEAEKRGRAASPAYLPEYQQQVPAELIIRRSCGCGADQKPFTSKKTS